MGRIIRKKNHMEYRHSDGTVTARFPDQEEKMVLAHQGIPGYKRILYLLIIVGSLYLSGVFLLVH